MKDCERFIDDSRASGVHDLLVELMGHCPCEVEGRVGYLFSMQRTKVMGTCEEAPSPFLRLLA